MNTTSPSPPPRSWLPEAGYMLRSSVPWSYNVSFTDLNLEGLVGGTPVTLLGGGDHLVIHKQVGSERAFLASAHGRAFAGDLDDATWVEAFGQLRDACLGCDDPWHRTILSSSDLTLHGLKWISF